MKPERLMIFKKNDHNRVNFSPERNVLVFWPVILLHYSQIVSLYILRLLDLPIIPSVHAVVLMYLHPRLLIRYLNQRTGKHCVCDIITRIYMLPLVLQSLRPHSMQSNSRSV